MTHRVKLHKLIADDPDAMMEIISLTQPFLAQRIAAEQDHELAKELMLEAKDPWDKLKQLWASAAEKEETDRITKIGELMAAYDPEAFVAEERLTFVGCLAQVAFVAIFFATVMYWMFTSDWWRDLRHWQDETVQELEELQR